MAQPLRAIDVCGVQSHLQSSQVSFLSGQHAIFKVEPPVLNPGAIRQDAVSGFTEKSLFIR